VGDGAGTLGPPRDAIEVRAINASGRYAPLFHGVLARGVALAPGAYEVLFCSMAHDEDAIDRTIEVVADAARSLEGARG
jgi:glutamate-1-semialdehyde 2,1-aminomutase